MEYCFVLVLLLLSHLGQSSQIAPPLYSYDDYDRCRQGDHSGTYCFVKVVYKEDHDPFDTPRIVTGFRRNLLDWGICVADCDRELTELSVANRQRLYQPKFPINFTYILPPNLWKEYLEPFKTRYGEMINICVNNRLERKHIFDRKAYSEIEYCTSKDELGVSAQAPDWLMFAFYTTVLTLLGLLMGANVLDSMSRSKFKDHIIVSSFSVRRNWHRLTEQPKGALYQEFGYIDGLRVLTCVLVLDIHCLLAGGIVPMENTEYAERLLESAFLIDYITASIVAIQVFFVIGGLLLSVTVMDDLGGKSHFERGYFKTRILNRLIRIIPVYFFFLLISVVGDDFPGVQVGAVGYKSLIQERAICRKKWWTNVLFIDNLPVFGDEHCSSQGWYLAADLQLFLATLVLLAVICKYPKRAYIVLWISGVVGIAIPAAIVYFLGLESSLPVKLSDVQFMFMHQPWHKFVYMPGYSNWDSYMAGVVVGYLYHQHKHNKLNLDDSWLYKTAKKARLPLLALAYLPTFIFYRYEIPRPSWLTTTHAVLYRNAGVIAVSITFIECFRNPPGRVRQFLTSSPMISLGKLSYSVYVLHVPVTRLVLNWFPPMIELSLRDGLWMLPSLAVVSYLAAVLVYICIELPASLVLKHYILRVRKRNVE
ncbi:regulator of hypoxia-inducible factor 1 [Culex quinquefasciatus]|uniref:regulator of hypoxia-inducible factor 1 n=1 Tax=Culex quinquefasciatus TaxID=7176 RepID=UPI0018E3535B|nr:regulator of hypoxia-inducible factor 1 [Culex quinquefasciatus]